MKAIIVTLALCLAAATVSAQDNGTSGEPRVRLVTNAGVIVIELDPVRAPLTVERFLSLVDSGFYNGLIFHRVIPGFLAQAGAFTAEYVAPDVEENVFNESGNGLSNLRGTVGFARGNEPHSGTSQFYINLTDNSESLNPRPTRWGYAVFGEVVQGMDVVDEIGHRPTSAAGPIEADVPIETVIIERAERLTD